MILREFGWQIAIDESQISTQSIEFMGWLWTTKTMTIQITVFCKRGILKQMMRLMEFARRKKHIRTRNLVFAIGEIQYTRVQFKRGTLYIKQHQKLKNKDVASWGGINGPNSTRTRHPTQHCRQIKQATIKH
ncbi:MAG: hypothetical protein EZS28_010909 [Streblomastix strix]|uniref:Uncharacterized protein n=1 Tax=Streblomastix strix TaxID=222440 RepID=A0A5J4WFA3_9EUKA|nr:MAG: hypothetical protein EZS28_010909 [Streblomastix strix]